MSPRAWSAPASLLAIHLLLGAPLPAQAPLDAPAADLTQAAERDRLRGALWGGGIGLVAGGVLGGLSVRSDEDDGYGGSLVDASATAAGVAIGAVAGAALGALLGATVFAPARRSADVEEAAGFSVDPGMSRGALAVSARLSVPGRGGRAARR